MKVMVAIPCHDKVDAVFMRSVLGLQLEGHVEFSFAIGSLVYDARNRLALQACQQGFDAVLWLDSDMVYPPDMFVKLCKRIEEGAEYVSALAFTRKTPCKPVIYEYIGWRGTLPVCESMFDYPEDTIFEIAGSGMGCVMMTTGLLERVGRKFGNPFSPRMGFGEDLTFCLNVQDIGIPMFCDSSIKVGHLGYVEFNEEQYKVERSLHENETSKKRPVDLSNKGGER